MPFFSDILAHAQRILKWRLNQVVPTKNESNRMNEASVPDIAVLRGFLAWRRTNLLVALPITLFSAIWDLVMLSDSLEVMNTGVETTTGSIQAWSAFGMFMLNLPYIVSLLLFLTVVVCAYWWNNWRRTRLLVKAGWALSFFLPFLPALFPLEMLLTQEMLQLFEMSDEAMLELQGYKTTWALGYVFQMLPLIVSFPGGAVRAAVRIRGLLPQSALTSWVLVVSAPFYSLLILSSMIVLIQVGGDFLLIIGALLLTFTPWIYVIFRRLYMTPIITEEVDKRLDLIQKIAGILNLIGFVFIGFWAFKNDVVKGSTLRFLLVGFSNVLITSIVFCDAFLRMTVTNWKNDKERRFGDNADAIDDLFAAIESAIQKSEKNGSPGSSSIGTVGHQQPGHAAVEEDIEVGISSVNTKPSDAAEIESSSSRTSS